jgi:hypothetical protein
MLQLGFRCHVTVCALQNKHMDLHRVCDPQASDALVRISSIIPLPSFLPENLETNSYHPCPENKIFDTKTLAPRTLIEICEP